VHKVAAKVVKVLEAFLGITTVVATVAMVALVFTNVVLRYGFNSGLTWSEELAVNLFVWVIFLGAILAAARDMHISVDLLTKRLPKKVQRVLLLITNGLVLVALYVLVVGGLKIAQVTHKTISAATGIPFSYVVISVVASALAMGLIVIYKTVRVLTAGEE